MQWSAYIEQQLQQRHQSFNYRSRHTNLAGNMRELVHNNQHYLNFASNDYLGLSHETSVIKAWQIGAERYGVGSGGSGHITGYSAIHQQLEQELADWLGYPRALLFNSGYAANQAVIACLLSKGDAVLADKLSHASLLEAAHQSGGQLRRFKHNDVGTLEKLLRQNRAKQSDMAKTLIVTEGIFSMDGDCAPLVELSILSQQYDSWLMVDDAHGIGVCGEQGRGSCWLNNIKPQLQIVTFGKAFGMSGAAVVCDENTAEYLLQFAHHLIYSTAMPIAQAYALIAALHRVQQGDDLRHKLQRNIAHFRQLADALSLPLSCSHTAIQPLIIGENNQALAIAEYVKQQGIWLTAIRPPTVPVGSARLRITLSAFHQPDDITKLVEVLYAALSTFR